MKSIFVDTAALIALGNQRDSFHALAKQKQTHLVESQYRFISSDFIIAEYCNAFSRLKFKNIAIQTVNTLYQSNAWKIIPADKKLMSQSFDLFTQMQDKEWGLVDCSSILIAREYQLTHIFTADKHFEQAGFQILLK
ncbi:MAG: PIN domain-containing protein [Methylococcaceae bacterium]|nr:PIN domain-containing protein [Methylococcaceae bacterium]